MGPEGAKACLQAGANDLGGTLMNESISRAAGALHGQEMSPEQMESLIRSLDRVPRQRTTQYGELSADRVGAAFAAPTLAPVVNNRVSRKQPGIDGQLAIIKPAQSDRHT